MHLILLRKSTNIDSGLSKDQMVRLRSEFGVYGTDTGRMCVAALNSKNIDYVCKSIAAVM